MSEVLCLFDENKFELQKIISYSSQDENISFFQTFYKGTYQGSIRNGMTFKIEEELDTSDFDDEMKQVFNLESAEAQSASVASDATSRSVMPAPRVVSRNVATILAECQAKLKNAKFKTAENKTISLETEKDSVTLTNADGSKKDVTEKAIGSFINLDNFLFTGNPCNTRTDENSPWHWANTEKEGAKALKKTADGKYTCQFRADSDDTLIRIIWNNWAADWGLSSIDKEKNVLPNGAGITDDTQAVNHEHPEWQDPRNIAITGLEAKRKYDITFDTKKSPGKICIELAEHKISTLDGWLFSGTPVEMKVSKYEHGGLWPINTADGALPLKKSGSNWTVTVTAKKGWNGFRIIRENWIDEIGWSSLDWENRRDTYNKLHGDPDRYALEDEDTIAFQNDFDAFGNFEGGEKITLTFGIKNGRVTCKTDIVYTRELDLDLYDEWAILESEPFEENNWNCLTDGKISSDKSFSFSISESSAILSIRHFLEKDENEVGWYQEIYHQRLESVDLPSGVNWEYCHWGIGCIHLTGLVPDKTYKVKLEKGNKTGYFKIIITEQ